MSDGTVNIDFIMNTDDAKSDAEKIKEIVSTIGDGAGDDLADNIKKNSDKAVDDAKDAKSKIDESFKKPTEAEIKAKADTSDADRFKSVLNGIPREKLTNLLAQAKESGVENFEDILDKLPKEKITDLIAKVNDGEVINFKELVDSVPESHTTEMNAKDNASSSIRNVGNAAEESSAKVDEFSGMMKGMVVGNVAYGALASIQNGLSAIGGQAISTSDAIQTFKQTMKLGGFGSAEIDDATKKVKNYADKTVYDLSTVSNTTAQLASNGIKNYEGLTEAAGNLNAEAGGGAASFKSVAMVMTQTAGAGKLTTENWNQLADAIPGASGVLQKAMKDNGAYTGNFRDAMEKGQISSKEFFNAIEKLGTTKGAIDAAKSTETFAGAIGNMAADVDNSIQKVIQAFGKDNLTGAIGTFGKAVSSAFDGIANLIKYLKSGSESAEIWLSVIKGVAAALAAFSAVAAVSKVITLVKGAFTALWAVLTANPIGIAVALIVGLGTALYEAYKHVQPFHDAMKNLASSISSGFQTAYKFVKSLFDVLTGGLNSSKRASGNAFLSSIFPDSTMTKINKFTNSLQTWVKNIGKDFQNFGRIVTDVFKIFTGGMSSKSKASGFTDLSKILPESTVQKIGVAANQVKLTITSLFNQLKLTVSAGLKFIEALVSAAFNVLKPIVSVGMSAIKLVWTVAWNIIKTSVGPIFKLITTTISNALKVIQNVFKLGTDILKGNWSGAWNDIKALTASVWNLIKGIISGAFNVVIAIFKGAWNGIKAVATTIWNGVKGIFSALGSDIRGIWNGIKGFLSGIFGGIWNSAVSAFNSMKSSIGGILDAISDKWHSIWNGVSSFFSGIWKDIKRYAKEGINGVIGFLNGGISGIDKVISFFGGSKKAIKTIPKLANGALPLSKPTAAIVNDQQGSVFREAILRNNGKVEIPHGRNVMTHLNAGEAVMPAEITEQVFGDIPQFAGGAGDWVSKLWNGTKSFLGSAADKTKAIADAIAHPLTTLKGIFSKVTNSAKGVWNTVASGAGGYLANSAVDWFKKTLKDLEGAFEGSSGGGAVPSGDHQKLMQQAGIPSSWWNDMNWIVNVESGWKTNATNASSGAYGLPQSLPGSKMASAGSDWRTNPVTQLKWMYNYVKGRYGTAANAVAEHKAKGWYAYGGPVNQEGLYGMAEGNKPEWVVPNPDVAGIDRTYSVLGQAAAYTAAKGGLNATQGVNSSALEQAVNKLVNLQSSANSKLEQAINKKLQVVLDSGKLVGGMYSKIDQKGYDALQYQQRNVWG